MQVLKQNVEQSAQICEINEQYTNIASMISLNQSEYEQESCMQANSQVILKKNCEPSSVILVKKTIGLAIKMQADTIVELIADELLNEVIPVLNKKDKYYQESVIREKRKLLTILLEDRLQDFQQEHFEVQKLTEELITLDDLKSSSEVFRNNLLNLPSNIAPIKNTISLQEDMIEKILTFRNTRAIHCDKKRKLRKNYVDWTKLIADELISENLLLVAKEVEASMVKNAKTPIDRNE